MSTAAGEAHRIGHHLDRLILIAALTVMQSACVTADNVWTSPGPGVPTSGTSTQLATVSGAPYADRSILFISPSSIDADRLASDKGGLVRGEERDHRSDFVGTAKATDRDRLGALGEAYLEIVAIFAPVGADRPRSANGTGADGIDGNAEGRQVECQRFGEADDCRLGGGISRAVPAWPKGGLRRNTDDQRAWRIVGTAARDIRKAPRALTPIVLSQASSGTSSISLRSAPCGAPALLTRMSRRP